MSASGERGNLGVATVLVRWCAACGMPWPVDVTTCPDDGCRLDDPTDEQSLPTSKTTVLPRREAAVAPANVPTAQSTNPEKTGPVRFDTIVNLVPGTLVGEYEVEKLLGSGAMGQVYGARHEQNRQRAAIKVIAPNLSASQKAIERFEQETTALTRLRHPNIVALLSVGMLPGDGRSYYVMEWLDGESLKSRVERDGLRFDEALEILNQVARGLEGAHIAGIVHRDIKPDNIWLHRVVTEPRETVKILDFGLAKLALHRRSHETAVGVLVGTPQYMSPEQYESARDVGPATDVYALGVIAYELLCGRLPFTYDNIAELVVAHLNEQPPRPAELNRAIDRELDQLLFEMLAKEPARRPTLAAVRAGIEQAGRRLARAQPSRRRTLIMLGIALVVLAISVIFVLTAGDATIRP